jgi:hypothetical protein
MLNIVMEIANCCGNLKLFSDISTRTKIIRLLLLSALGAQPVFVSPALAAPTNLRPPTETVSSWVVGQTVTLNKGAWSGAAVFSANLFRGPDANHLTLIPGVNNNPTYVITSADIGNVLVYAVSGWASGPPPSGTNFTVRTPESPRVAKAAQTYPDGYHVAPNGSDANPGTVAAPLLTLNKANAMMEGAGGLKTTYVHAGTYKTSLSLNGPRDNGETWQYYPPDSYNSAIIDASGWDFGINSTASNTTINGIKIINAKYAGVQIIAGSQFVGYPIIAQYNTIKNCEITGMTATNRDNRKGGPLTGAIVAVGNTPYTQILNNYVHDVASMGIRGGQTANLTGNWNFSNTIVKGNVLINTATNDNDVGAIDFLDYYVTKSTNILIDSNYINNYISTFAGHAIYLDYGTSNVEVKNNIITGGYSVSGTFAILLNDGNNVKIYNNIFDLNNANYMFFYVSCPQCANHLVGSGNTITNNIVLYRVGKGPMVTTFSSGTVPWNFYDQSVFTSLPINHPLVKNNYYANYNVLGAGPWYSSSGNTFKDSSPVLAASAGPGISCWSYKISSTSPVLNPPVSFVPITAAFGPPGFIIPRTGAPPSYPTSC